MGERNRSSETSRTLPTVRETDPDRAQHTGRTAVVFVSHVLHESVFDRFEKLARESAHDVFFAYDATSASTGELQRVRETAGERARTFVASQVLDVDYPDPWTEQNRRVLVPGNTDLLYLYFARLEPAYSRYWFVEYDVAYTGHWSELFGAFENSSADLLGTTLQPYEHNPGWPWWKSLETVQEVDRHEWVRGFFPIVRLSRSALEHLDEGYRSGWSGHFEAVLPTLVAHHGLEIEDLGGDGLYVRDENRNRFYSNIPETDYLSPGTLTYRPTRARPGRARGKLWHPVKPSARYLRSSARLLKRWVNVRVLRGP